MIEISRHTDTGDVKKTNQDCIFAKIDTVNGHLTGLFIVADGCGGLSYGEEISNLVVTHFSRVWNYEVKELLQQSVIKPNEVDCLLEEAIKEINDCALSFSHQVESKVGSTLSLLFTVDDRYFIKNVGDSRIYLLRGKRIFQITEDQSLVADMVRNKEITKKEAANFKKKNVLTMCIGFFDDIKTYSKSGKIKHKDVFLLCCDGVHNRVPPEKMIKVLKNNIIPFEAKAEEIRNAIGPGMASDNVSTVICRFTDLKKKAAKKKRLIVVIALLIGLAIWLSLSWNHIIAHLDCLKEPSGGTCPICGEHVGAKSEVWNVN